MLDMTDWMNAADGGSKLHSRVNDTNTSSKIAGNLIRWILQFYVSQTSTHLGSSDSRAVLVILLTAHPGCFDAFVNYEVMEKGETNAA